MKRVTLISKEACHLCDVAKNVLLKTQKKFSFDLEEVKIIPGTQEFDMYHERIPVILIDDTFAFEYKVSERQLLDHLTH